MIFYSFFVAFSYQNIHLLIQTAGGHVNDTSRGEDGNAYYQEMLAHIQMAGDPQTNTSRYMSTGKNLGSICVYMLLTIVYMILIGL